MSLIHRMLKILIGSFSSILMVSVKRKHLLGQESLL
jgi:hypothetical protein